MNNHHDNIQLIISIQDTFHSIGYKKSHLKKDYQFVDFLSPHSISQKIDLGIFGQEPFDYRSACFGINVLSDSASTRDCAYNLRALGAPQFFIISNGKTERWKNLGTNVIFQDSIETKNLVNYIESKKNDWNPSSILRQKTQFSKPSPRQMDLFVDTGLLPALDYEASIRMDSLIHTILNKTESMIASTGERFSAKKIFNLVFRLLTAKLLYDREIPTEPNINFSDPNSSLNAVSNYYGHQYVPIIKTLSSDLLIDVSKEIGSSFSFKNLSVDTLTYIYENTFVSPQSRKELGIHSTPSYVADYVLGQLPLEEVQRSKIRVYDPMSGHGIFLIAAMRRLRDVIPSNWTGRQRHEFYTKHLIGTEIDNFSIEVAKMCLTLADFPEADGWDIRPTDIFKGNTLESLSKATTVLIGNPPFEYTTDTGVQKPKPSLLIDRALPSLPTGALFGLILPRSFLDGSDYREQRKLILNDFNIISLTTLPDKIFLHSDAETTIIIGEKNKNISKSFTSYYEVRDEDRNNFRKHNKITWIDEVSSLRFCDGNNYMLTVPFLRECWEYLENNQMFKSIADLRVGVAYEPSEVDLRKVIKEKPFKNSVPAISNVSDGFQQYVASNTTFIATNKTFRRKRALGAWNLDWDKPKVVLPASRLSRGPWRHAAAIDRKKRFVTRNFFAAWPKDPNISVELLASILNSPIATAFTYSNSSQRNIPKRVYDQIPIPNGIEKINTVIKSLVNDYINAIQKECFENALNKLQIIDAYLLQLYKLPPRIERKLLDIFWNKKRPVPFEFKGYIPPQNASWIPWHIYISENYKRASGKNIVNRLPIITNVDAIKYLIEQGSE